MALVGVVFVSLGWIICSVITIVAGSHLPSPCGACLVVLADGLLRRGRFLSSGLYPRRARCGELESIVALRRAD